MQPPKYNPNKMRFFEYETITNIDRGHMARADAHRMLNSNQVDETTKSSLIEIFNNKKKNNNIKEASERVREPNENVKRDIFSS